MKFRTPHSFTAPDVLGAFQDFARSHDWPVNPGDLERRFFHMERLLTLGQVTAEIVHDFGNLMTIVLGYTELLLDESATGSPQRPHLEHLHRAAEHAATLTSQLLDYMRDEPASMRAMDLSRLILGMEPMLTRLLGRRIRLTISAEQCSGEILADPKRIEQAVVNLVMNARESIAENGRVDIDVTLERLDRPMSHRLGIVPAGDYVRLRIRDNGAGMEPQAMERIFQPFFTTRVRGTGLGLAIVARVSSESGAAVLVDSQPGAGTAFSLYFPQVHCDC